MTKTVLYKYLGTNGTIVSPVHLEDVYYIRQFKLTAKTGKQLTKDFYNYRTSVIVPEEEVDDWKEV